MAHTNDRAGVANPLTLTIDVGGSYLKAAGLRVKTPKPAMPDAVVAALIDISQRLGQFERSRSASQVWCRRISF